MKNPLNEVDSTKEAQGADNSVFWNWTVGNRFRHVSNQTDNDVHCVVWRA
jgi:hypothetical protein